MKEIGGYFSLEAGKKSSFLHHDGKLVNTGRNAFEYILRALGDVKQVYIPYYTCSVMLEPLNKLGIPYSFYHIDTNLEIAPPIVLNDREYLLYTNYFGIKDAYCAQLAIKYGNRLIIDNAQAWYTHPYNCAGTIYSPRKFVGIPDGGVVYCKKNIEIKETDTSFDRCSHLLKRIDLGASGGYADFQRNSDALCNSDIKQMSKLTKALLANTDFIPIQEYRRNNFKQLHTALADRNKLQIPDFDTFACPMVYPYFCNNTQLKKLLIANKVFIATYWPNVYDWCSPKDLEYQLADYCLALPIDQRYGEDEMNFIIETILLHE